MGARAFQLKTDDKPLAFSTRILFPAALVATALTLPVFAQSKTITGIDALREWNLVVLGNLESSSEVEGPRQTASRG
jgi:hypothetical protein